MPSRAVTIAIEYLHPHGPFGPHGTGLAFDMRGGPHEIYLLQGYTCVRLLCSGAAARPHRSFCLYREVNVAVTGISWGVGSSVDLAVSFVSFGYFLRPH